MRKISIKSQQSDEIIHHESEARTLGELKEEMEGKIRFNDTRCIIKGSKATLEFDDSLLPEGEFVMFVYPQKSKGGDDAYDSMSFNELRTACKDRDEIKSDKGNYGGADLMRKKLRKHDKNYAKGESQDNVEETKKDDVKEEPIKNSPVTTEPDVATLEMEAKKKELLQTATKTLSDGMKRLRDDLEFAIGLLSYIDDPENHDAINKEFEEMQERISPNE